MFDPELAEAPLTLDCVTTHAKVVLATLLVSATELTPPEHNVCELGVAVADGIGLTVMATVIGVPEQLFAVGVIV